MLKNLGCTDDLNSVASVTTHSLGMKLMEVVFGVVKTLLVLDELY